MHLLNIITIVLSILAHSALAYAFVADYQPVERAASFYEGEGDEQLNIDAAIKIEGMASLGQDIETVQAVEMEPQEARDAIEAVKEVKPVEYVEEQIDASDVIAAKSDYVEESEVLREIEPEEVQPVVPQQVVQAAQAEQIVLEEMVASAGKQTGGDVTKRNKHLGKISTHIRKYVINPQSRSKGTAIIKFKVDPSGELLSWEVVTSSGSQRLDRAALDSVQRAAPFPAFPEGAVTEATVLTMSFNFKIRTR